MENPNGKNNIQSMGPENEKKFNRTFRVAMIALAILLCASIVVMIYLVQGKSIFPSKEPASQNAQNISQQQASSIPVQQAKVVSKKTYYVQGSNGNYNFVDLKNGKSKRMIPDGYAIVSQHNYDTFPDYLILQKDGDLFAFSLEDETLRSIFGDSLDLKLQQKEEVAVQPSITEEDKFYIVVSIYDSVEDNGMAGRKVVSSRAYFYDAASGQLEKFEGSTMYGCFKYDSKNKRFFSWLCGEGIGNSLPLSVHDLNGENQRDIVKLEEFGKSKEDVGFISVKYGDGYFVASSKSDLDKVMIIYPQQAEPVKEIYPVSEEVRKTLTTVYPYSAAIDKSSKAIIIGGDDSILVLKYDSKKQITESKYFDEPGVYANFIFAYAGKVYYQTDSAIKNINLAEEKIENGFSSQGGEEVTIVSIEE